MDFKNTYGFAEELDDNDELKGFRNEFHFPQHHGKNKIYFTGNSLGLMPKRGAAAIQQELDDWAKFGVDGHFEAKNPWVSYHDLFKENLSKVIGTKPLEVTPMGGLTGNLHFLMVSFYQPKGNRTKILCEGKAFPSDQYALETHVKFHGLKPEETIVELFAREGEIGVRKEDILAKIEELGDELAMIMIGGVNYYTGQVFPMKEITAAGHKVGAIVGFDLAHAAGNVKLELHDWGVDFAAWCSYKYLNSGPGSVAGIYVHEKHSENNELNRFAGWWGTPAEGRFKMTKGFIPATGADAWMQSNAPVLAMAVHKVALELHLKAGVDQLIAKQKLLTSYLEFVLEDISNKLPSENFTIITPKERGSQLSILTEGKGKELFNKMTEKGVVADWREPNVIRVAPVPMYNSFTDVFNFGQIIEKSIEELK